MTFGTIYIFPDTPRSNTLVKLARYLNLDVEAVPRPGYQNYTDKFPLGKAPAFETPHGFKLTETTAIMEYLVLSSSKPQLMGSSTMEKVLTSKWNSFINSDLMNAYINVIYGKSEEEKSAGMATLKVLLTYLDNSLTSTTYLTGDELLVCDCFATDFLDLVVKYCGIDLSSYKYIFRYYALMKESFYCS